MTSKFKDDTTEEIYLYRHCPQLADHVCVAAHRALRLLFAATTLEDVAVIGSIHSWPNLPGLLGVHVIERWYLLFRWDEEFGANEVELRRRK